eukprot:jgi/Mesvir1/3200/Mv16352-RA.3
MDHACNPGPGVARFWPLMQSWECEAIELRSQTAHLMVESVSCAADELCAAIHAGSLASPGAIASMSSDATAAITDAHAALVSCSAACLHNLNQWGSNVLAGTLHAREKNSATGPDGHNDLRAQFLFSLGQLAPLDTHGRKHTTGRDDAHPVSNRHANDHAAASPKPETGCQQTTHGSAKETGASAKEIGCRRPSRAKETAPSAKEHRTATAQVQGHNPSGALLLAQVAWPALLMAQATVAAEAALGAFLRQGGCTQDPAECAGGAGSSGVNSALPRQLCGAASTSMAMRGSGAGWGPPPVLPQTPAQGRGVKGVGDGAVSAVAEGGAAVDAQGQAQGGGSVEKPQAHHRHGEGNAHPHHVPNGPSHHHGDDHHHGDGGQGQGDAMQQILRAVASMPVLGGVVSNLLPGRGGAAMEGGGDAALSPSTPSGGGSGGGKSSGGVTKQPGRLDSQVAVVSSLARPPGPPSSASAAAAVGRDATSRSPSPPPSAPSGRQASSAQAGAQVVSREQAVQGGARWGGPSASATTTTSSSSSSSSSSSNSNSNTTSDRGNGKPSGVVAGGSSSALPRKQGMQAAHMNAPASPPAASTRNPTPAQSSGNHGGRDSSSSNNNNNNDDDALLCFELEPDGHVREYRARSRRRGRHVEAGASDNAAGGGAGGGGLGLVEEDGVGALERIADAWGAAVERVQEMVGGKFREGEAGAKGGEGSINSGAKRRDRQIISLEPMGWKDYHLHSLVSFARSWVLPEGYPGSVSPEYLPYMLCRAAQYFFGGAMSVFCTRSLLHAVGASQARATSAAIAANWVIKDGSGRLGKMMFAAQGKRFDSDLKQIRWWGDLMLGIGASMELVTVHFPGAFLPIACAANVAKNLAAVALMSTRTPIYKALAAHDNIGEVTAKGESICNLADLLGMALGIGLSRFMKRGLPANVTFAALTGCYLYSSYHEVYNVVIPTFNEHRLRLATRAFLDEGGRIMGVLEANEKETEEVPWTVLPVPIWSHHNARGGGRIVLGARVQHAFASESAFRRAAHIYRDDNFLLHYRKDRDCIFVVLKEGASPDDIMRASFQAHCAWQEIDTYRAARRWGVGGSGNGGSSNSAKSGGSGGAAAVTTGVAGPADAHQGRSEGAKEGQGGGRRERKEGGSGPVAAAAVREGGGTGDGVVVGGEGRHGVLAVDRGHHRNGTHHAGQTVAAARERKGGEEHAHPADVHGSNGSWLDAWVMRCLRMDDAPEEPRALTEEGRRESRKLYAQFKAAAAQKVRDSSLVGAGC